LGVRWGFPISAELDKEAHFFMGVEPAEPLWDDAPDLEILVTKHIVFEQCLKT
jgi:hypothetical protein